METHNLKHIIDISDLTFLLTHWPADKVTCVLSVHCVLGVSVNKVALSSSWKTCWLTECKGSVCPRFRHLITSLGKMLICFKTLAEVALVIPKRPWEVHLFEPKPKDSHLQQSHWCVYYAQDSTTLSPRRPGGRFTFRLDYSRSSEFNSIAVFRF